MLLHQLNGTSAGTADIKSVLADVGTFGAHSGVLLYLDEIQYLNKKQQQSLLECLEDGSVTLIASTTENPYFYVYNALLSRAAVFEFKPLSHADVLQGLKNALRRLSELDGVCLCAPRRARWSCWRKAAAAICARRWAVWNLPCWLRREQDDGRLVTRQDAARRGAARAPCGMTKAATAITTASRPCRKASAGRTRTPRCITLRAFWRGATCSRLARRMLVIAAEDVGLAYPMAMAVDKGLCGQRPAAWHAGGAASPCRGRHPAGHCAQKQHARTTPF